jgi:hypothetical protein
MLSMLCDVAAAITWCRLLLLLLLPLLLLPPPLLLLLLLLLILQASWHLLSTAAALGCIHCWLYGALIAFNVNRRRCTLEHYAAQETAQQHDAMRLIEGTRLTFV